ncbi:hypothetical protein F7725_013254 [Dissostichus mawsoni]|uniref:Iporin n=1 Tax=Dissostichus mawsoni TaxID=36200 RepID=A0A7J5YPK3_DISMA|nr:hypothetical protein F7725_013254 [Dissostichus mawsoni]
MDSPPNAVRSVGGSSGESSGQKPRDLSTQLEDMDILGLDSQLRLGSSGSNMSMDCGEQDWGDDDGEDEDHPIGVDGAPPAPPCDSAPAVLSARTTPSTSLNPSQSLSRSASKATAADSSCNSSDGVLVNFSAIYNKMNNSIPEKPPVSGTPTSTAPQTTPHLVVSDPPGNKKDSTGGLLSRPSHFANGASLSTKGFLISTPTATLTSLHILGRLETSCPVSRGQAHLVVATQNYYKLVTWTFRPSRPRALQAPRSTAAPMSTAKAAPHPTQPNEYFLFRQRADEEGVEEEDEDRDDEDDDVDNEEEDEEMKNQQAVGGTEAAPTVIQGQVYVNISPPTVGRGLIGASSESRPRSRSYDRNLDKSPTPRSARALPHPASSSKSHLFRGDRQKQAEKRSIGGSPPLKGAADPFSSTYSTHSSVISLRSWSSVWRLTVTASHLYPSPDVTVRAALSDPGGGKGHPSSESRPVVVRYTKDQRPTTLPIQPFTFHHQFASKPPQPKPLLPLLTGYVSEMQARSGSSSSSGSGGPAGEEREDAEENVHRYQGAAAAPPPGAVRPSPLGSYSPVRLQGRPAPGPAPPAPPALSPHTASPAPCIARPQESMEGAQDPVGQSAKLQQIYSDFLPDYFSMTERPPEEFCLSPDASSSSSSGSSSHSHISVDLTKKRGSVKAVNTAVDLIVAHFGTSRDPDVKAKLGNSWVSPNVGHLILKYLCPALHEVLQDGLKAYVLDLIIGQRRCQPWSLVEASTQLGPSTRVLHSLFSKVSQFSELTSHSMRLNAFIFGLLNLKSLEFWFNHLYTHEAAVAPPVRPGPALRTPPPPKGPGAPPSQRAAVLCGTECRPIHAFNLPAHERMEHYRERDGPRIKRRGEEREGGSETGGDVAEDGRGRARREGVGDKLRVRSEAATTDSMTSGTVSNPAMMEEGFANLWKERGMSGERMKGVGQESQGEGEEKNRRKEKERDMADEGRQRQERQAGWWYQLMQSSQVYIDQSAEGSKFVKTEKRKKSSERRPNQLPPTREGVVEGAESSQEVEGRRSSSSSSGESAGSRKRPSWMGSPPDSVLNQEKETKPVEATGTGSQATAQEESPSQGLRWGRLFGSTLGSPSRAVAAEQKAKTQKNSEVRALCHHIATEPGQLSFNKGDILRVLSKADPDWLLCSLGSMQGLVPIIYVTLKSMEDRQEATRLGRC